ncbi:MAG TPA: PhzF family phenazine biosynthesis protein [Myxococcota bacterium]|jgi:trans-2,3-dihydro-3-hydroxyanthranilate isomerase|nr:PhzF family phenazine biosynthesis protein [Myxococcota bacterium]
MPRLSYVLVDVFTRRRFGGNPLAVFPEAQGYDETLLQPIARELNLSETTFVQRPTRSDCDFRVRIFTPRAEMPMAGHPTVGTAFVLGAGERMVFQEGIGPIPVEKGRTPEGAPMWTMTQPPPRFGGRFDDRTAVAASVGLRPGDLSTALPLEVVATGPPFLMVPVKDLDALKRARQRPELWEPLVSAEPAVLPYLFVQTGASSVRARMFAASHGIVEDPATGAAAGPLAAYLVDHGVIPPTAGLAPLRVEQGLEMGRPSVIHCEVEGGPGAIRGVRVGGECVSVGGGYFDV